MFLQKLKRAFKKSAPSKSTVPTAQPFSIWEDTGQVYYLENTLKLTYQSNSGLITLEKLSMSELPNVIKDIELLPSSSPLAIANIEQQQSAFNISICGVTWQKNEHTTRIKAISDAALLRSQTACFSKSQAIFRHATLLEHDDFMTSSMAHPKRGMHIYNRVSVEQFIQQIVAANARISSELRKTVLIKSDNFDRPFTEHETAQIEQLININPQKKLG